MSEQDYIERDAAEEMADVPLTETEEQTSRRSAGQMDVPQEEDGLSVDTGAYPDEEDDFE